MQASASVWVIRSEAFKSGDKTSPSVLMGSIETKKGKNKGRLAAWRISMFRWGACHISQASGFGTNSVEAL